jgi:hypothetical protein
MADNPANKWGVQRRIKDQGVVTNWYSTKAAQKAALTIAKTDPRVLWYKPVKR